MKRMKLEREGGMEGRRDRRKQEEILQVDDI